MLKAEAIILMSIFQTLLQPFSPAPKMLLLAYARIRAMILQQSLNQTLASLL